MKTMAFACFNILKPKLFNAPFTLDTENKTAGGFHRDVTMGNRGKVKEERGSWFPFLFPLLSLASLQFCSRGSSQRLTKGFVVQGKTHANTFGSALGQGFY